MSIPVLCHGCGQRGKVASIPADLVCVACMTGDHLDLDDRTAAVGLDPTGNSALLPSGTPEQDQDFALLTDDEKARKVVVPEGSPPYTQRALALADSRKPDEIAMQHDLESKVPSELDGEQRVDLARLKRQQAGEIVNPYGSDNPYRASLSKQADLAGIRNLLAGYNGQSVTCTYDDDLGLHTVAGILTYHPPAVIVGKASTTDFHVLAVSATGFNETPIPVGDAVDSGSLLAGAFGSRTAMQRHAASSYTYQDDYHTASEERFTAKVEQITAAVLASNPGMPRATAKKAALKTVGLYPKVAG